MRINVNYIGIERDDAITKVNNHLFNELRDKVNFNIILFKTNIDNRFIKFIRHIKDSIILFKLLLKKRIIHFESTGSLESILIFFIHNKRSVLTAHHLEDRKYLFDLSYLFSKLKHKSFSKIIAVSEKTKRDLIQQYKINSSKIIVAYNGVDKKIFKPTNRKINLLKNKKYILYLGSEVPRKNIENLLKAFKEISKDHPNLILVKAGQPDGKKYRENTKRLIKDLNLKNKVLLTSRKLKEEELPLYYSNAELFVYPTLKEGFGMPLVEAMACGCPVVTSNLAPMNEIAKGQVLVNPYNYKDIAKGINKILSNKEHKEELIKKAIIRSKDFDWSKFANKVLKVYEKLDKN